MQDMNTIIIETNARQIGLAAAGAAALGLSLSDGLLQPVGSLARRAAAVKRRSSSAELVAVSPASAAAPAPAPVAHKPAPVAHKPAASAGLFDNL